MTSPTSFSRLLVGAAIAALITTPAMVLAQFMTPNVITTPGDVATTLGSTVFVNHGLVGVGRISASAIDMFADSFGSVSGLQITDWAKGTDGAYSGTFNILPDRGYNIGNFYADYAARVNQVGFSFTPHSGTSGIGGSTDLEKLQAQNQITFTTPVSGLRFRYDDPVTHTTSFTTGLDPGSSLTLFGKPVPYVTSYTGQQSPSSMTSTTYNNINKLPLDSEALILKSDGTGYVGDEYGGNVYYFDSTKKIIGVIVPPAAFLPHAPAGTLNFSSAATPVNGRRNNQGFEGVSLSPDGSRLFVLLQSATVQDSNAGANDQLAKHTRLLIYDVSSTPTPATPIAEYALTLPTYKANGNNSAPNKTLAQSEVVALDASRFLVLSRDGNGLGNASHNPSMFKSVLLVDISVGAPTNFAGDASRNAEGGKITTAPGVLDPAITPLTWVEALNMLNGTQLNRFNIVLDTDSDAGGAFFHPQSVSKFTLGEKWEGMALVPALDSDHPNDYFLFIANDNDFLTSNGIMRGPDGTQVNYNGFNGYPVVGSPASNTASRVPPPVDSANNENDTMFLAFRVTITAAPSVTRSGFVLDRRTHRFTQQVTLTNGSPDAIAGPVYLALDGLSSNATLANGNGVTVKNAPAGSPYITILAPGGVLAPGASVSVVLQFDDPTQTAITYATRVLVLTGSVTP